MNYPYGLKHNPFPSSPTPTEKDARVLGGTRHKRAKEAIVDCISELYRHSSRRKSTGNDFRVITLIQDVGSGKTHLALHIKGLKTRQNISSTYVDLATISPKTKESLYDAIIRGFDKRIFDELRTELLKQICEKAEKGDSMAKKALNYGFGDRFKGVTLKQKVEDIIFDHKSYSKENLPRYLAQNYNPHESTIIMNILARSFSQVSNLDELLGRLTAISEFSHNLLGKIILYEFDEFDAEEGSMEFVKSLINAHLPASVMLLIATPSAYGDVQKNSPSTFDRLEKANYKIDLAGSNSIDELIEIATEYIKQGEKSGKFTKKEQENLAAKIRVLCDEFPDFRSVRSLINILYHATEKSAQLGHEVISEASLDETIKSAFPGLKVRGSIMDVPIGDFLKLRRDSQKGKAKSKIKEAISNLVNFAHELGNVSKAERSNRSFDAIYSDSYGNKTGIAVIMDDDHSKNFSDIQNVIKSAAMVDKLIILTNTKIPESQQATIINIDKSKLVDLLYFNDRYVEHKIAEPENEKIQMLARTINVI